MKGAFYEVEFGGYVDSMQTLQVINIGRDVRLDKTEPENIPTGKFLIRRRFLALSDRADFVFSKDDSETGFAWLYGISAKLLAISKN